MSALLLDASEAELDEMIRLVDQLHDRTGIDWEWFVSWAHGKPRHTHIRSGITTGHEELMIPATAQAVINWLVLYKQRGYP